MEGFEESLDEVIPTETAAPGQPSRPFTRWDRAAAWAGGLGLAFSPLLFTRAPSVALWKVQLLLSEGGHWVSLGLLLLSLKARRRAARGLALAAALLCLAPLLAAWRLESQLEIQTELAWGPSNAGHPKALRLGRLFLPATRWGLERNEETYDAERGLGLTLWSRSDDQGLLTRRPMVLVLHGGGWDSGQRGGFDDFNAAVARLGWVAVDVDYRLAPAAPWPAQREDLMRALEYLRLNAKRLAVDPEHVVLLGRSAGAHLALDFAYGTQDSAIQGVIAFYGPSDLRWAWEHAKPGDLAQSFKVLAELCGGPPQPGGCYDDASPLLHVNAGTPPTLLLHGGLDNLVWPAHSERLAERLSQQGVPHQLLALPWATHGFDWLQHGPGGQAAWFAVERFLLASERHSRSPQRL